MPFHVTDLPTLHRMQAIAERVRLMIHARACEEYGLAFGQSGSKSLDCCIIHNSLVGLETGKPWREVNYHHMRRANWLLKRQHIPGRIVTAWYRRKCGLPAE